MEQSPTAPREVTVDEAMAIAIRCQKNGQLAEAEALYRKVLELKPDQPDALHYSGVLAHQQGRSEEAIALITRSLDLAPDQPDWHSNLGIIFQDKGKLQEAVVAYRRALVLQPTHANAHNNIGVLLRAQGMTAEAEEAYRTAIRLNPDQPDAYHNLAILLSATHRTQEAVTCYCKALTLKPQYPEARRLLALAYCVIGQPDKAVIVCEEWLKSEPDDPVARHTLAAVSGRDVPTRASDAYVQKTFDSFAASFEAKLAKLDYQAPALVAAALADAGLPAARTLDVLDAGCGTGLCGPLVAPYARWLVGVDLSEGMLEHAREKNVYDELVRGELIAYLQDHYDAFDLIVTADTLVYFGALKDVAAAAAGALRSGGRLIFTVEEATEDDALSTYCIKPHGRFNHRAQYVECVLVEAGLKADIARAELRMESGAPVAGLVVTATKPATPNGCTC
ncbi:MAG: tetratricopeptide repeat protein [Candidatus Rokubacteria bacterium]|nr:tetratricopeptide repeat protein [Candidatus Rokubacteria bacterium]